MGRLSYYQCRSLILSAVIGGCLTACATSQQGQQGQQQSPQDQEADSQASDNISEINELSEETNFADDTGLEAAEPSDTEVVTQGDAGDLQSLNQLSNNFGELGSDEPDSGEAQAPDLATQPLPPLDNTLTPAPMAVMPLPASPADSSKRVVRFVRTDGIEVRNQASASGAPVATLSAGDPLVVLIQGDWAEIVAGRYVPTEALSETLIPRPAGIQEWSGSTGKVAAFP